MWDGHELDELCFTGADSGQPNVEDMVKWGNMGQYDAICII